MSKGEMDLFKIGNICQACVFLSFLYHSCNAFRCHMSRQAYKSGFHRDLETNVTIDLHPSELSISDTNSCKMVLVETLLSSLYVDIDQIKMIQDTGGPKVYSEDDIDIEKPEHLSKQHTIYVYSQLEVEHSESSLSFHGQVSLPVHIRYHTAGSQGNITASAYIESPELYLHCPDIDMSSLSSEVISIPCQSSASSSSVQTCASMKLSCTQGPESRLEFQIPVGQLWHKPFVVMATIATIAMATTYLVYLVITKDPDTSTLHHKD